MVAVFWDYENCQVPFGASPYTVVKNIRDTAHDFGAITAFKAYFPWWSEQPPLKGSLNLRSDLQACGVSLTDCPCAGADKFMLVDMLTYAMDNSQESTLVLISGNVDFAYALSTLRLRKFRVVVIAPFGAKLVRLRTLASLFLDWSSQIVTEACTTRSHSSRLVQVTSPSHRDPSQTSKSSSAKGTVACPTTDAELGYRPSTPAHETGGTSADPNPHAGHSQNTKSAAERGKPLGVTGTVLGRTVTSHQTSNPSNSGTTGLLSGSLSPVLPHVQSAVLRRSSDEDNANRGVANTGLTQRAPIDVSSTTCTVQSLGPHTTLGLVPTAGKVPREPSPTALGSAYLPNKKSIIGAFSCGEKSSQPPAKESLLASSFMAPTSHSQLSFLSSGSISKTPHSDNDPNLSSLMSNRRDSAMSLIDNAKPNEMAAFTDGADLGPGPMSAEKAEPQGGLDKPESMQGMVGVCPTPLPARTDVSKLSSSVTEGIDSTTDFSALIELLRKEQSLGNFRPLRSKIGLSLMEHNKELYRLAGAASFREYAASAERRGIVQMGGKDGHAWMSLHPGYGGKQPVQPTWLSQPEPLEGTCTTRRPPPEFAVLVELLRKEHLQGNTRALRSIISAALVQQDKRVYEKAGVRKFSEYSALAEKAGVVEMGGKEGGAWIALHPDWRRESSVSE